MEERRDFIMKIVAGKNSASFSSNSGKVNTHETLLKNVLVHQVFFWLKDPDNQEARNEFEKGLQMLSTAPQILSSHIGTPVASARTVVDDSFTYSFLAIFRNKEDHDLYQNHPIHLQFLKDCQPLREKVLIFDAMD
jgi:hypothetical protein